MKKEQISDNHISEKTKVFPASRNAELLDRI